jgi:myo-inositol catabolism protein IolC
MPAMDVLAPGDPLMLVMTDEGGRRWVFIQTSKAWLAADVDDEAAMRALLRYVRAGSMSTEIWRQRP